MQVSLIRAVAAALLFASSQWVAAAGSPDLVGTWKAPRTENSLGGTLLFRADGTFSIKPDTMAEGTGKYEFDGQFLTLRLDSSPAFPSESVVRFSDKKTKAFIQFTKGPAQEFVKVPAKK